MKSKLREPERVTVGEHLLRDLRQMDRLTPTAGDLRRIEDEEEQRERGYQRCGGGRRLLRKHVGGD